MKIERLLQYAADRQVLEARIRHADGTAIGSRVLPVGLITPSAPAGKKPKPPYVLAISWSTSTPRFEQLRDGELMPLHAGGEHTELDPDEALPTPWWADPAQVTARRYDTDSGHEVVIPRMLNTQLAMLELIAAALVLGLRVRFQYANQGVDQWRDATIVGVGGKHGHLVYGFDHDRLDAAGEPKLRTYNHNNIRGFVVDPAILPAWIDGAWRAHPDGPTPDEALREGQLDSPEELARSGE